MEKIFHKSRCLDLNKKTKQQQQQKIHVHIAFRKLISDYDCFDKILELILVEQKNRNKENSSLRVTNLTILDF